MDFTMILFLFGAVAIGVVLIVVIAYTHRNGKGLDMQEYQKRWMSIECTLTKDQTTSYQVAIFEADKLLDRALRESGKKGATMGERMKASQQTWKNANHVWGAHKIRNQLAHESDFSVSYGTARRALAAYKQGLKDLGAF